MLASGSQDLTVRLWDVGTGSLRNTLTGHTDYVYSVAFSPDGTMLASGGRDRTVRLWDVGTGSLRNTLTGHTSLVNSVAFSPDGTMLASGSWDRTVRLWDVGTGSLRNTLTGHTNLVNSVAFSPGGTMLASGGRDRTVRLWDVGTGSLRNTLQHTSLVNSVAFSPDGTMLASGGSDSTVRLWDVGTGSLRNTLTGHTEPVYSVAFSPDGNTLTSGSSDGTVLLWRQTPTTAPLTFTPSTVADQTFEVGTPVNLTLPSATGGTEPYTYSLTPDLPAGLQFDATNPSFDGTPTTLMPATPYTYTVTDAAEETASLTFTIEVTAGGLDVNGDGRMDVLDLVWVAVSYGMRGDALLADVNADGVVNVQDLIAVAEGIDAAAVLPAKVAEELLFAAEAAVAEVEGGAGAPMMNLNTPPHIAASGINAYGNVAAALADARLVRGIPAGLLELLQLLAERVSIPETTMLLPNYPNPFNPETWIPYHLSKDAMVTLMIYDASGSVVRELLLGHQAAGVYESRGRAAYWDGRNQIGEKVASGLYFYTLTAGDFTATRKLLIRK